MPVTRQILYPARLWFILTTIILALLGNLVPSVNGVAHWMPDWLLLTLLFWGLSQPRRVGFGVVFFCGLLMDVAAGQKLGQYPLAYVLALYLMLLWHRRLLMLALWQQALHIGGLLFIANVVIGAVRLLSGGVFPGLGWFIPPLMGMLLWPVLTIVLQLPQRRAPVNTL